MVRYVCRTTPTSSLKYRKVRSVHIVVTGCYPNYYPISDNSFGKHVKACESYHLSSHNFGLANSDEYAMFFLLPSASHSDFPLKIKTLPVLMIIWISTPDPFFFAVILILAGENECAVKDHKCFPSRGWISEVHLVWLCDHAVVEGISTARSGTTSPFRKRCICIAQ